MIYFFGSGHSALAQHQRNVTPRWLSIRVTFWCHACVPLNSERTYCIFSWLFLQIEWIHNKDYLITGFGKHGCTAPFDPWSKYPRWKGKPYMSSLNICSVADSVGDPDPQDPHVFGPPGSGSGSISQRYGSGSLSFSHKCVKTENDMPVGKL